MSRATIATLLLGHLEQVGLTRHQLAGRLKGSPGLSKRSVYDILGGRRVPSTEQLYAIHKALALDDAAALALFHAAAPDAIPEPEDTAASPIEAAVRAFFEAHPPETLGCASLSCRIRPPAQGVNGPCVCHERCADQGEEGPLRAGLRLLGRLAALVEEEGP